MSPFVKHLSTKLSKYIFSFCCLALILISLSFAILENVYHGELDVYLPHYLGNKNFLNIIFDPICELDFTGTSFRGRELGNIFNFIDAKALTYLFKFNVPAFISITYYASLIVIAGFITLAIRFIYKKNQIHIQMLTLALLSSPPIILGGIFYRANKIISGSAILICILLLDLIKKNLMKSRKRTWEKMSHALLLASSVLASLSDEQGFALVILLLVWDVLRNFKKPLVVDTAQKILIASILFAISYRICLGPYLFHAINGINATTPSVDIPNLINSFNLLASFKLLMVYTNYLFGNFDLSIKYLVIIWLGLLIIFCADFIILNIKKISCRQNTLSKHEKIIPLIWLALKTAIPLIWITSGLVVIIHIMTLKHPAIFWPDIVSYYSLPIIFFIFGMVFISLHKYTLSKSIANKLGFILAIIFISNISSWSHNFKKVTEGHLKVFMVANKVIEAVYSSNKKTNILISEISFNGELPGKRSDMKLGEHGINALKNSITK